MRSSPVGAVPLARLARSVLVGMAAAAAYDVVRHRVRRLPLHDATVGSLSWGLRGVRLTERWAETARLRTADLVAEARARIGEEAPPPGASDAPETGHDHQH